MENGVWYKFVINNKRNNISSYTGSMSINCICLVAETKELFLEKLGKWKRGMEMKGFRTNAGETKIMRCRVHEQGS